MKSSTARALRPDIEPTPKSDLSSEQTGNLAEIVPHPATQISAYARSRNEDAVKYLPFVRRIASRIAMRVPPHIRLEDLVSAGMVGMLEALDRFDASRGRRFESFAEFRIRGAILDELRRNDSMARDARIASKNLERTIADLAQKLGRSPEESEIAAHLGMDTETLREQMLQNTPVQLVVIDDMTTIEPTPGESSEFDSPFRQAALNEIRERLSSAIRQINPRLRMVLSLYYYEQLQMKDIADLLNVSVPRVSQLISEAIHHLRALLGTTEDTK